MSFSFLRPIAARLAAALIGALVAWLTARGIDLPADTQAELVEATVAIMLTVFGIVYSVGHKLLNRKINPADAATPDLVKVGKIEQRIITQGDSSAASAVLQDPHAPVVTISHAAQRNAGQRLAALDRERGPDLSDEDGG